MECKAIVSTGETITISTEQYRQLVTAKSFLDVILEAQKDEKSYVVDNVVEVVSRCVNAVITAYKPVSETEGCATNA